MYSFNWYDQSNREKFKAALRYPGPTERKKIEDLLGRMVSVITIRTGKILIENGKLKTVENHGVLVESLYVPFAGALDQNFNPREGIIAILNGDFQTQYSSLDNPDQP